MICRCLHVHQRQSLPFCRLEGTQGSFKHLSRTDCPWSGHFVWQWLLVRLIQCPQRPTTSIDNHARTRACVVRSAAALHCSVQGSKKHQHAHPTFGMEGQERLTDWSQDHNYSARQSQVLQVHQWRRQRAAERIALNLQALARAHQVRRYMADDRPSTAQASSRIQSVAQSVAAEQTQLLQQLKFVDLQQDMAAAQIQAQYRGVAARTRAQRTQGPHHQTYNLPRHSTLPHTHHQDQQRQWQQHQRHSGAGSAVGTRTTQRHSNASGAPTGRIQSVASAVADDLDKYFQRFSMSPAKRQRAAARHCGVGRVGVGKAAYQHSNNGYVGTPAHGHTDQVNLAAHVAITTDRNTHDAGVKPTELGGWSNIAMPRSGAKKIVQHSQGRTCGQASQLGHSASDLWAQAFQVNDRVEANFEGAGLWCVYTCAIHLRCRTCAATLQLPTGWCLIRPLACSPPLHPM